MARTNFKYEKRQKELAKQKKAEEKRLRKLEKRNQTDGEDMTNVVDDLQSTETSTGEETTFTPQADNQP